MCRNALTESGRRCPCDTPDARRARRYAAAGKADPRLGSSEPGKPPEPSASACGESGFDLTTAEGISGRAQALRSSLRMGTDLIEECLARSPSGEGFTEEQIRALISERGGEPGIFHYRALGSGVVPLVDPEAVERESTALGAKVDAWLNDQLSEIRSQVMSAHEEFSRSRVSGSPGYVLKVMDRFTEGKEAYYQRKRELMGQLRETGGTLGWQSTPEDMVNGVNDTIQASARFFPKDWVDASNRYNEMEQEPGKDYLAFPLHVRRDDARNHYQPNPGGRGMAELTVPTVEDGVISSTATHELTHRMENVNFMLGQMEAQFIKRRTALPGGEKGELEPLQQYHSTTPDEWVRPDNFIDRYVGKSYGENQLISGFHEVMSMGMEAAFHGEHGSFGKLPRISRKESAPRVDRDHHAFVLGAFLTA